MELTCRKKKSKCSMKEHMGKKPYKEVDNQRMLHRGTWDLK